MMQWKRYGPFHKCDWESCLNIWKKKMYLISPHTVHQNKPQMDLKVKYKKRK